MHELSGIDLEWELSLLRSICCLFAGRCEEEEPKPTMRNAPPGSQGDLGQKEAELAKSGKEQMSHMEGGTTAKSTQRR